MAKYKNEAERKRLLRAQMTEEERERHRAQWAEQARKRRAQMTEEEREKLRARDAQLKREKRLTRESAIAEEGVQDRNARVRQKRAEMTDEERNELRAKWSETRRKQRAAMSEEERELMRAKWSEAMRQKRSVLTQDEKRKINRRKAERLKDKENETTVERLKRLISLTGVHINKNPDRYQTLGSVIKNAFWDIRDMHFDIQKLKNNLKVHVATAVKNVFKLHLMERRKRMAAGYRSLTFVEISAPRDPNSCSEIQSPTDRNEIDPLVEESELVEKNVHSNDKTNETATEDSTVEDFKLFIHDTTAFAEMNTVEKISCTICSKKFSTSLGLTIHQQAHKTVSNEFKCFGCPQTFFSYNTMIDHYLQAHSLQTGIDDVDDPNASEISNDELEERSKHEFNFLFSGKCSICSQTFDKSILGLAAYSGHIISDHSDNKELMKYFTYNCLRCEKPLTTVRALECHWKTYCLENWKNENLNTDKITCENCGMQFLDEESLVSHNKIFHTKSKVVCDLCGGQLSSNTSLKTHMEIVHHGEYKFSCEYCGQTFKTTRCLLMHTRNIHTGGKAKSFVCKFCGKGFAASDRLEYHVNTHTGEKPFKCKICGKSFAARTALSVHEGVHEGFICKMCGESFNNYYDLCRHRKFNHSHYSGLVKAAAKQDKAVPSGTILSLSCDVCDKKFTSYLGLDSHKRYSHGDKKFECDICGKSYKRPLALRKHKYSHDNLLRFGCSLCDEKFRGPDSFYIHRKRVHFKDSMDAKIVKLIEEKKSSHKVKIIQPTSVPNSEAMPVLQKATESNPPIPNPTLMPPTIDHQIAAFLEASNINCLEMDNSPDPEGYSPGREDYSPEMEYDNEINENEIVIPVSQNLIGELGSVSMQSTILHAMPTLVANSTYVKQAGFGGQAEVLHSGPSSSFIDFSRANVPSVSATSTTVKEQKYVPEKKTEQKQSVFIEDEKKDAFLADVDIQDLVKVKIEARDDIEEDESIVSDDEMDSNYVNESQSDNDENKFEKVIVNFPQDPYSPCLIVKLTKLLEHKCVICNKTIFTDSQREIRRHVRSHRLNISIKKEMKRREKKEKGKYRIKDGEKKNKRKHKIKDGENKMKRRNRVKDGIKKRKERNRNKDGEKKVCIFDCSYCDLKDSSAREITAHCVEFHPGQKPFRCKICPRSFTSIHTYYNHKTKRHNPPKPKKIFDPNKRDVICEMCGKAFHTKQQVYVHKSNYHRGEIHKCPVCSRFCSTKGNLGIHMKRCHSGEEVKTHLCEECGKAFFTKSELSIHMDVVHKKIKRPDRHVMFQTEKSHPFGCNVCPLRFVQECGLLKHLPVHDPARQYVCDLCGSRFKHYNNLFSHKQGKHKIFGPRSKKAKAALQASPEVPAIMIPQVQSTIDSSAIAFLGNPI